MYMQVGGLCVHHSMVWCKLSKYIWLCAFGIERCNSPWGDKFIAIISLVALRGQIMGINSHLGLCMKYSRWDIYNVAICAILYFLEILPCRNFISSTCLVQRQFEGGICRDRPTHTCTASIISVYVCMYNVNVCVYCCWPFSIQRDFEGSVCWDEWAGTFGEILRTARFQGVARLWGNTVCTRVTNV